MEDFSAQPAESLDSARFHNDLEPIVTARYRVVHEHLEWLGKHANARMTGSGSSVFAGFASREGAQRVLDLLPAPMTGFVAQGLTHHPLLVQ
jgi:4-diphosphocytidyl-2-C-methyl-D-erythritol kinase